MNSMVSGNRRLEEHLITAQLVLDKTLAVRMPVWVISIDLSKAFDRILWPALWQALLQAGVSKHPIWIIQRVYAGLESAIRGNDGTSSRCGPGSCMQLTLAIGKSVVALALAHQVRGTFPGKKMLLNISRTNLRISIGACFNNFFNQTTFISRLVRLHAFNA